MKWLKKGLIYAPDKSVWWQQHYAMMPTPVYLSELNVIRIYFGTTDINKFGRTTFIDVDVNNPSRILNSPSNYILDLGKRGTFDDAGAVPSSIMEIDSKQYLYYVGFQRTQGVPYMLYTGLSYSSDWRNFVKFSEAPIIDRNSFNILSNAAPHVVYDIHNRVYRMWFWVGKEWVDVNNKLYINAEINTAKSNNGTDWDIDPIPCIIPDKETEFSVGRPWVIQADGVYKMFYSIRYIEKLYRLGYAESIDGIVWQRKDNEIGIDVSKEGWDSEMICYPAVITVKGKTYLFYNGNNNGETGFGYAELIEE